jgi:4-hydroxybenzoate polyprenyltransferase/phosphoserine phosphatase
LIFDLTRKDADLHINVRSATVEDYSSIDTGRSTSEFLCVDLDGTVIKSDLLWESLLALMGTHPWFIFFIPLWLFKGRAALKHQIARRVNLNVSVLPFRKDVIAFLVAEKARGRKLILATGSSETLALAVAGHLGLFDFVLASDGRTNLTGKQKKQKLQAILAGRQFDYIGNSNVDLPLWEAAQTAIVVGPSPKVLRALERNQIVAAVFEDRKGGWSPLAKALRPLHWTKNLLVFVPLVMAHDLSNGVRLGYAIAAFVSFSLCASGMYMLNDLFDLEADRLHPIKRTRVFAAGDMPLWVGSLLVPLLVAGGLGIAALVSWIFLITAVIYVASTTVYSTYVKRVPIVDVLLLTGLYLLRILGGGVATDVPVSPWLLAFSMFFLLSQAFTKRQAEFIDSSADKSRSPESSKRNYIPEDLDLVRQFGVTSGYLSVLVLALYINGREVTSLYRHPQLIWLACPLLLFWISRLWFITNRGQMNEDPVVFATHDRVSYLVGFIMLLILFAAS